MNEIRQMNILVVDDNQDLATNLAEVLKKKTYAAQVAFTGKDAIDLCRSQAFDLVIVDYKLPDMDGLHLQKRLSELMDTDYFIITAHATLKSAAAAVSRERIVGYETKPLDIDKLLAFIHQISERKKAQANLKTESELRMALLDKIPGCIAMILKKGSHEIVASNRRAEEIGAIPGRVCFETTFHRNGVCPCCRAPMVWEDDSAQRIEVKHDGKWYEEIWERLSDDLYVHYIFDITHLKQTEEKLVKALKEAESANQAKSEFLANMSHEIRTPINAMLGFTQILQDQHYGPLNNKQLEYLDNILDSSNRLLFLINDILDLSKVEAGKIEIDPRPFHFDQFMERTHQFMVSLAGKKDIATTIEAATDIPNCLIGDEYRIEQVLKNLIGNAVKFTDQGRIDVSVEKQNDCELLFTVRDTGIGIPKSQQKDLFAKFYQADSSYSKKYKGAGLGLAISKELIALMGGEIWFTSDKGKGSVFHFKLKLDVVGDADPLGNDKEDKRRQKTDKKKPLKILIAEDDELNRESLTYFLNRDGHTVKHAANGHEVLRCLAQDDFNVILMDVQMPEMNGIEVTRRIRASNSGNINSKVPIMALTAYAMKGDRERFLAAGMNDYIAKPVDINLLMKKINTLVSQRTDNDDSEGGLHRSEPDPIGEINKFIDNTSDKSGYTITMLKSFLKEAPVQKHNLETVHSIQDLPPVLEMAHKLAGMFACIHLSSLANLSKRLEQAARQNDKDACLQFVGQIEKGLDAVVAYLKDHQLLS